MKKLLIVILFAVFGQNAFCQTERVPISGGGIGGDQCLGGKCASDCWFTECQSCCPEGTYPDCTCFLEFARCKCKVNALANSKTSDVTINIRQDRIETAIKYLTENKSFLLDIFTKLNEEFAGAREEEVSENKFRLNADKYFDILDKFESELKEYEDKEEVKTFKKWVTDQKIRL